MGTDQPHRADVAVPAKPWQLVIKLSMAALALVLLATAVWPKARLSVVWAAGRGEGCSFTDTVNSHDLLVRMERIGREIGAASHVIAFDPAGYELVETPKGRFWTVPGDRFLRATLAEQELEIYGSQAAAVQAGDIVLDCGANVGVFTRTALSRGARLVVAVEPAPATVECLRRNFASEIAQGRVIVSPKGVWDRVDTLELALGSDGNTTGNSFVFGRGLKSKVKVPLTTIDLLAAELHLPRVDFIKMDIEGAEKQALRGGAGIIRTYKPRMAIASEHLAEDPLEIPRVVQAIYAGYRTTASSCKDDFSSAPPEVLLFQARSN